VQKEAQILVDDASSSYQMIGERTKTWTMLPLLQDSMVLQMMLMCYEVTLNLCHQLKSEHAVYDIRGIEGEFSRVQESTVDHAKCE
jgi:hypothetical protein